VSWFMLSCIAFVVLITARNEPVDNGRAMSRLQSGRSWLAAENAETPEASPRPCVVSPFGIGTVLALCGGNSLQSAKRLEGSSS
jgi:hypothetical protein